MATELLGYDAERWALFNIAIQPGAILAVVVLYWRTFWSVFTGPVHARAGRLALRSQLCWWRSSPPWSSGWRSRDTD